MSRGYTLTRLAENELDELVEFVAKSNLTAAVRLYRQAIETFEHVSKTPELGPLLATARHRDIRVKPIREFPNYLVFYRLIGEQVEVVRVVHGARNWKPLIDEVDRS